MSMYRSEEGKRIIQQACREIYASSPFSAVSRVIETSFGPTHVLTAGDPQAPPLLLLHGSSSNSASWFSYAMTLLEDLYLILPDIPGQPGLSSEDRPSCRDGALSHWLEEITAAMGLHRFFLCGMSLGGYIALEYTSTHPGSVIRLVLIAASGIRRPRPGFFLRILPLAMMGESGTRRINKMIYGNVPVSSEAEDFALLASRHTYPMTESLRVFSDEEIASIASPVLYIGGEDDPMLDAQGTAGRLKRLLPSAKCMILRDTAHIILDQSDAIHEFLLS